MHHSQYLGQVECIVAMYMVIAVTFCVHSQCLYEACPTEHIPQL